MADAIAVPDLALGEERISGIIILAREEFWAPAADRMVVAAVRDGLAAEEGVNMVMVEEERHFFLCVLRVWNLDEIILLIVRLGRWTEV